MKKTLGCLAVILLIGLVLRGALASYGLPLLLYEDEPIYLSKALAFGSGDFDPHYFKKPPFFLYFYFAFDYIAYLLAQLSQPGLSWQAFEASFWQDPTALTQMGRWITILFSCGSIVLLYLIGSRIFSPFIGLCAALLLAIQTTHVQYTPIIISDIPSLFCILLTAWLALRLYDHGRWQDYVLCGLAIGLTMSFKYNVFSAVFLVTAHGGRYFGKDTDFLADCLPQFWNRRLLGGLGIALLTFVVLSPYVVLNVTQFMDHVLFEKDHVLQRTMGINQKSAPFISFPKIVFKLLPRALGWPLYATGCLGILLAILSFWPRLRKRLETAFPAYGPKTLILLSFPIVFLLLVSNFRLVNAKYLLPLIPFILIMAPFALESLLTQLTHHGAIWQRHAVAFAILALVSWPMAGKTLQYVGLHQHTHTLVMVQDILNHELQQGNRLLIEKYTFPSWNMPLLNTMFADNTLLQMGQPETTAGTISDFDPDYVLINPKPIKTPDGTKILPFPTEYYAHLNTHYTVYKAIPEASISLETIDSQTDNGYLNRYTSHPHIENPENPGPLLFLLKRVK